MEQLDHADADKLKKLLEAVLLIGADLSLSTLLQQVLDSAIALTGAKYGALGVINQTTKQLEQFITSGLSEEQEMKIGSRPTGKGVLGLLILDQKPIRLHDIDSHPQSAGFPEGHPTMKSFIGVPIICDGFTFGNLYLSDKTDNSDFSAEDEAILTALAKAAGMAIENSLFISQANEYALATERTRIARDLHDEVIQRLFGVGLSLQSVLRSITDERIKGKIDDSIDQLDSIIKQIRTTIFALDTSERSGKSAVSARRKFLDLIQEYRSVSQIEISLRFSGPIDTYLDETITQEALPFIREALSNVIKHSRATSVIVESAIESNKFSIRVTDNGVGLPKKAKTGNGIANMIARSQTLGGNTTFIANANGGLTVLFEVPVKLTL